VKAFLRSFWAPLSVTLAASLATIPYLYHGFAPTLPFYELWNSLYGLTVIMWVVSDARRRTGTPCYDFGFLLSIFVIATIPWYVISTRGFLRGLLVLTFLLFLGILPEIAADVFWATCFRSKFSR
jgi:hypothetical protein